MGRRWEARRRHTPEFKVEAVRLTRERLAAGITLQRIGEELELSPDMLRLWCRHVDRAPAGARPEDIFPGGGRRRAVRATAALTPSPSLVPERPLSTEEELARLKRENERLRQERDFLKKAAAFFANESR
jgi:transposase